MRKKRQQEELAQQQQQQLQLQEPFYVRANASTFTSTVEIKASPKDEVSSLGSGDRPNVTILAPISICLGAMLCYIVAGAFTLHKLDGWSFVGKFYLYWKNLITLCSILRHFSTWIPVVSDINMFGESQRASKKLTRKLNIFLALVSDWHKFCDIIYTTQYT